MRRVSDSYFILAGRQETRQRFRFIAILATFAAWSRPPSPLSSPSCLLRSPPCSLHNKMHTHSENDNARRYHKSRPCRVRLLLLPPSHRSFNPKVSSRIPDTRPPPSNRDATSVPSHILQVEQTNTKGNFITYQAMYDAKLRIEM